MGATRPRMVFPPEGRGTEGDHFGVEMIERHEEGGEQMRRRSGGIAASFAWRVSLSHETTEGKKDKKRRRRSGNVFSESLLSNRGQQQSLSRLNRSANFKRRLEVKERAELCLHLFSRECDSYRSEKAIYFLRTTHCYQASLLLDARVERSDISGLCQKFSLLVFGSSRFWLLPAVA